VRVETIRKGHMLNDSTYIKYPDRGGLVVVGGWGKGRTGNCYSMKFLSG
jgi:hypothetical protein